MPRKILYIEDNPEHVNLVKHGLEARGYDFLHAGDGKCGIEMAEAHLPDVILLDSRLPDMDGFEVAKRIRNCHVQELCYVPIIAVIANALRGEAEKALAAGCDGYMEKPIDIRELWMRIEGFLSKA